MDQRAELQRIARATWAAGDYDLMMRQEGLYGVGSRLVEELGIGAGEEVLDIACGTGNAALPAAQAGARVTGLDLTPRMLAVARRRAEDAGVEVTWTLGDAEDLPYPNGYFDVVVSTFGCMFAPRHRVAAAEIARVLRPGGRMGLCTWTPEGAIGDFFRTVGPHLPPPPAGAEPPLAWGEEEHVRELFADTGIELRFERQTWLISHGSVDAAIECYTTAFGPTVQARSLASAQGRWPELRDDLGRMFARLGVPGRAGVAFPAEYLVVLGRKAVPIW